VKKHDLVLKKGGKRDRWSMGGGVKNSNRGGPTGENEKRDAGGEEEDEKITV